MFRRYAYQFAVGASITLLVVLVLIFATSARADGYVPQPQASGTTLTVPDYADIGNKQRALNWRRFGLKYRPSLIRLSRATGFRPLPAWYPPKSKYTTWRSYGTANARWAMAIYRQQRSLLRQVTHPGGSGVYRWKPLLLYCGLPKAWLGRSLWIMRGESHGNPWATNGQYKGLFQFGRAWYWGRWNPYNPYQSALHFVRAVRAGGWSHWAATDRGW
jgi:hypothetical protein